MTLQRGRLKEESVQHYPAVAGYHLTESELQLLPYWLQRYPLQTHEQFSLSSITRGLNFFPNINWKELEEILDWQLPLLLVLGERNRADFNNLQQKLFQLGAGGVWLLPDPEDILLFPRLALPSRQGEVFFISDDSRLRKLFRQIFLFSGYDIRTDFRTADEIASILDEISHSEETDENWPHLIVVDLDSHRVDLLSFFHSLRKIAHGKSTLKPKTRLLVMKDFGKPGQDVTQIAPLIRPFTRRVFHPHEALHAAMEVFLFRHPEGRENKRDQSPRKLSSPRLPPGKSPTGYRTLEEFLFGHPAEIPFAPPRRILQEQDDILLSHRRSLPFLWLYDFLESEATKRGAILSPQPGVDAGDLLHGIGGPDSTREPV